MRISGGATCGIPLVLPKGDFVRPATDAMRQAVFSSLAARVPGAAFLDLFSGSGSYGLEAVSRGAARGVFVEKNAKALACIDKNLTSVCKSARRSPGNFSLLATDATRVPWDDAETPDLVFIDPPYDMIEGLAERLFGRLSKLLAAHPDPIVVFEVPGELNLTPTGWECVKRLGKGVRHPTACFFKLPREPAAPV